MNYNALTAKSVEIIGKCLEQCLCTKKNSFVADFFGNISPFDEEFYTSSLVDSKIVEDRFVDALVNASITNDCDAFKKYLSEILVEAERHECDIKKAGAEWVQMYACDTPTCFRDYAAYLEQAEKFAKIEESFFRQFCNTRKHGRKMWNSAGAPIRHDLHKSSSVCSDNYSISLYTLKQCAGKDAMQIFGLYKRIISCFLRTYRYAQGIDLYAQSLHSNPIQARIILNRNIEQAFFDLKIQDANNIDKDMIDLAKRKIDARMLNSIYNKTIMDLAPFYYHYITTGQFPWFSILLKDKENHYGKLTEIEHDIFKGIKDPMLREKAALNTRKLIYNFAKLQNTKYEGCNHQMKTLTDGEVLAFIVEDMDLSVRLTCPMKKLMREYFCKLRNQEKDVDKIYKAFNYAKNNMSDHDNKKKAFDKKVKEILDS